MKNRIDLPDPIIPESLAETPGVRLVQLVNFRWFTFPETEDVNEQTERWQSL